MKIFLKTLSLGLLLSLTSDVYSQDTVRVVDFNAVKDKKRGGLPYDQEFKLRIRMPNAQPNYFVKLYAHRGKFSFVKSLAKDSKRNIVVAYMARVEFEPTMTTRDSILTLYFKHDDKSPPFTFFRRIFRPFNPNSTILKPGRRYSLIIGRSEEKNNLIKLLQKSFDGTGNEIPAQKALYSVEFSKQFANRDVQGITALNPENMDPIFQKYKTDVLPTDKLIAQKISDFNSTISNKTTTAITASNIELSYKYFSGENALKFVRCADTCALDKILKQLYNMSDYAPPHKDNIYMWQWLHAGKGELSLLGPQTAVIQNMGLTEEDYSVLLLKVEERSNAISNTINSIQQYIFFLTNLELALTGHAHQANIASLKQALIAENKELQVRLKLLKELQELLKERNKIIVFGQDFASLTMLDINTHVFSFTTRNELSITPVFGYAFYGFQKGFNSFTPYLGFQVNFQAMNKDIPFKLIPEKTLLQRINFTTAWTLAPVGDKSKRFDLFNTGSLLTGLGFKLGHAVSINAGAIWFKKLNTNPVLTDKTMAVTPFASVSINSEISKLLGDFTKLLPAR